MTSDTLDLGFVPFEAQEMDRWLKQGHPALGWRGDPRLELRIGVLTAANSGFDQRSGKFHRKGERVGWRWEVWRNCEDGTEQRLLQRPAEKIVEIIPQLIKMDPRTPGFEQVMDTVEREDRQVQAEKAYAIGQAHGEAAEHLWKLVADTENGKTTFRGLPGRNPDKQL